MLKRKYVRSLGLVSALVFIAGCGVSEYSFMDLGSQSRSSTTTLNPPGGGGSGCKAGHDCQTVSFTQNGPTTETIKKLDILIVTDTSASLRNNKQLVLNQVSRFSAALPAALDLQWGIILGHSSQSAYSGVLFQGASSVPRILKSTSPGYTQAALNLFLTTNFLNAPSDPASDGGEEMLYSLSNALTASYAQSKALKAAQAETQNFFRPDAALAVIFITDENDICFPPELNGYPTIGPDYQPDPDGVEIPAYNRDCRVGGVNAFTPEKVLERIKARKGEMPAVLSGIIYTNPKTVPMLKDEDAVGHGILELLQISNGLALDIADQDFSSHMTAIGEITRSHLELKTEFNLGLNGIDSSSVKVRVDGVEVPFQLKVDSVTGLGSIVIDAKDAGHAGSIIDVDVCVTC